MNTNTEIKTWQQRYEPFHNECCDRVECSIECRDAEIADLRAALEAAQQQLAQRGDGELPPLPKAAGFVEYNVPASQVTKISDGYTADQMHAYARAALAQRAGSGEVIGWYRDCQIDANEDSQNDLPPRYFDHRAIITSKTPPPGDGWKPLVDAAPPAAVQPEDRFYFDHDQLHDRVTGQHLWTQDQYDQQRIDWYKQGKEDALLQQPDSGRDAARFVFEHTQHQAMYDIEVRALNMPTQSIHWWREQIDAAALAAQPSEQAAASAKGEPK